MSNDKVVSTLRKIQQCNPPELLEEVIFIKSEVHADETITNFYKVNDGPDTPGYLTIRFNPETKDIIAAEMNVNFNSLIGFNRSPIELRILSRHILQHIPGN